MGARLKRRLRRDGFAGGKALAEELARGGYTTHQSPDFVASVVHRVSLLPVVGWTCLPRSLTLWVLLERAGHSPELRIGAAPRDEQLRLQKGLAAHAWVEVDGRSLGENVAGMVIFDDSRLAAVGGSNS